MPVAVWEAVRVAVWMAVGVAVGVAVWVAAAVVVPLLTVENTGGRRAEDGWESAGRGHASRSRRCG